MAVGIVPHIYGLRVRLSVHRRGCLALGGIAVVVLLLVLGVGVKEDSMGLGWPGGPHWGTYVLCRMTSLLALNRTHPTAHTLSWVVALFHPPL